MSKFFTYEDRLSLQKYLKDSLAFKEIARRMDKNPTTISREVRNYSSHVATGYPGFPFNACKTDLIAERKRSVQTSVPANRMSTVNYVSPVIHTAQTSWKKSVWQDFACPMSAMVVKRLVSALS